MGSADENWMLPDGYDRLVSYLATNGSMTTANSVGGSLAILTNKTVTAINYGGGGCTVITADGAQYAGDACISTIPAGVLKHRNPTWTPSFPADKAAALQTLRMGDMGGQNKVYLLFETKFWVSDALFNGFLQAVPTSLNRGNWSFVVDFSLVLNKPVLLAFSIGNHSLTMEEQSLWQNWLDIKSALQAMCTTGGIAVCPTAIVDPFNETHSILLDDASGAIKSGAVRSNWMTVR